MLDMKELDYQTQLAALNVQLGPSKLLLEMLPAWTVQLVKVLLLHSQHAQLVWLMSTMQMLVIYVVPVTHPVRPQTLPLGRQNVVSEIEFYSSSESTDIPTNMS